MKTEFIKVTDRLARAVRVIEKYQPVAQKIFRSTPQLYAMFDDASAHHNVKHDR